MADAFKNVLKRLGIADVPQAVGVGSESQAGQGAKLTVRSPIDGSVLAEFNAASSQQVNAVIERATAAFPIWRDTPAPTRGELVRQIGNAFREQQDNLAVLVTREAGKINAEARGEATALPRLEEDGRDKNDAVEDEEDQE